MISKTKDTEIYNSNDEFYRSTKHEFNSYLNTYKMDLISNFIDEYRRVMMQVLDELWCKQYQHKGMKLHLKYGIIDFCPAFFQTSSFNCLKYYTGNLSGRMLSNVLNQLKGIISGIIKSSNATSTKPVKPDLTYANVQIPPKFIDYLINKNNVSMFKEFIILKNLIKKQNILIPIKLHEIDDKYSVLGQRLKSILLTKTSLNYIYEIKGKQNKKKKVLGCDMGINKLAILSDGQVAKKEIKNKTFKILDEKIKRKKKGSKAYKKSLREMKCFTQEALSIFDLSKVKKLKLESNKGLKKNTSNANHHWSLMIISDKILRMCQDSHVDCVYTPAPFKSQRCFKCGFVHKENRHGEKFVCNNCYHTDDADLNASKNNSLSLPYDTLWSFAAQSKDSGFFWFESHCSLDKALSVP